MKFKSKNGDLDLPVFFPDATRAVLKTLDSKDLENTNTEGILVNTYHLYMEVGKDILKAHKGVRGFMNWKGGVISDSGGFQVMSLVKKAGLGKITDEGVIFRPSKNRRILFTPEKSIKFQMQINRDMLVVLDDFTPPMSSRSAAFESVERTINWARRSKQEFERLLVKNNIKKQDAPYLLGVVQGGDYPDLRKKCIEELVKIGFDGFGYGGWPIKDGEFDYQTAEIIAKGAPKNYLLYGLGIGKPEEIVRLVDMGYHIFDCVLPTRDARHKRLYVYNTDSIKNINVREENFYSYYVPNKQKYARDTKPVSTACDCLLCTNYSRSYLAHLFRIEDSTALRLATIHNLRFYSILMEKLRT